MAQIHPVVKVWNNGTTVYREEFKGDMIEIPAKTWIKMENHEAHQFLGVFTGIKRTGGGQDIKTKPLSIEYFKDGEVVPGVTPKEEIHLCMACKEEFKTKDELELHSKQHEAALLKDNPTKKKFFS